MKKWFSENINKFNALLGIAYILFWVIGVAMDLGESTNGPYIITIADVILIPFVMVLFPMFLGFTIRK